MTGPSFWRSSIGGKVTMAVTGLMLFGFVVAHLIGNLLLLAGPDAINAYAKKLHDLGPLLWVLRIVLLAALVLHVVTGVRLARANRAARPVRYAREDTLVATFASRSMVLTGLSILFLLLYHLAHYTFGLVHEADYAKRVAGAGGFDVHAMVVSGFSHPAKVVVYAVFQLVLFLHLRHGVQSLAQTLGLNHARWTPIVKGLSIALAAAIAGGNLFLAGSVLTGIVKAAP